MPGYSRRRELDEKDAKDAEAIRHKQSELRKGDPPINAKTAPVDRGDRLRSRPSSMSSAIPPTPPPPINVPAPVVDPSIILAIRRSLGYSQGKFAKAMSVAWQTVDMWEKGRRFPSRATIKRMRAIRPEPPKDRWDAATTPDRIRALRERLGITREELAGRLRCSDSTVFSWERGRRRPSPAMERVIEEMEEMKDMEEEAENE